MPTKHEGDKKGMKKSSSKRWLLIAAVGVALLAVTAVPAFAAAREDNPRADAIAELFGFADAEAFADFLGFEVDEQEPAGPASSNNADEFAVALDFDSAEELADYLGLEGGEDELAQIIQDSDNPNQLAEALNFDTPDELAEYLGVDRSVLAQALRLENRAQLVRVFQDADTPNELADALGYGSAQELAEELGVDRSELRTLLDSAKSDDGDEGSADNGSNDGGG